MPSQIIPALFLSIQVLTSVISAAIIGLQAKFNFNGTVVCLLYKKDNDLSGESSVCNSSIGISLIVGLLFPLILSILQILIHKKKIQSHPQLTLGMTIFAGFSAFVLFVGACMVAVGLKTVCDYAQSNGYTCQTLFDSLKGFDQNQNATHTVSGITAAYICSFVSVLCGIVYTVLKAVEYKQQGGKASMDSIRNMLPSSHNNGGGRPRSDSRSTLNRA